MISELTSELQKELTPDIDHLFEQFSKKKEECNYGIKIVEAELNKERTVLSSERINESIIREFRFTNEDTPVDISLCLEVRLYVKDNLSSGDESLKEKIFTGSSKTPLPPFANQSLKD